MSYVKAGEVLPEYLVEQIQEYVDGQLISIPGKNEKALSWGEKSSIKNKLAERNKEVVSRYYSGEPISSLGEIYFLPEKRIRGIIYEYESSKLNNGGFNNE